MHTAFQDTYADKYEAIAMAAAKINPHGHQLKSHWDGDGTVARYTRPEHSGGARPCVWGPDCVVAGLPWHRIGAPLPTVPMPVPPGGGKSPVRYVTASLRVDFRRPTPMGTELLITGRTT